MKKGSLHHPLSWSTLGGGLTLDFDAGKGSSSGTKREAPSVFRDRSDRGGVK